MGDVPSHQSDRRSGDAAMVEGQGAAAGVAGAAPSGLAVARPRTLDVADGHRQLRPTPAPPVAEASLEARGVGAPSEGLGSGDFASQDLRDRDRLLQATAEAMSRLLAAASLEDGVGKALAVLGQASDVDRVYIFENSVDPATHALSMAQRHEWCAPGIVPQIDNEQLLSLPYADGYLGWLELLSAGRAVGGPVRELPPSERIVLEAQGIRAILVLPIHLHGRFWGFIGFDDCRTERAWTRAESSILRAAAVGIGYAYLRAEGDSALRNAEERYRSLVDNLNIGVFRHDLRPESCFLEGNPALVQMLRLRTREELRGLSASAVFATGEVQGRFVSAMETQGEITNMVLDLHRTDGEPFVGAVTARMAFDPRGGARWIDGVVEDVTERRRAEERQRVAAAVFEAARDAIIVADAEGRVVAVNPAFTRLTGYEEGEVVGSFPLGLWAERPSRSYFESLREAVGASGVWHGEMVARRKTGERRVLAASLGVVRDAAGEITHYVGSGNDCTELLDAQRRIDRLAHFDALTGLPNRALLCQRAELALALATRRRTGAAVIALDLDGFKDVNDAVGHAEGDGLLKQAAARLQPMIRATDTLSRLGGDSFAVLLTEADQEAALVVADKLLAAFREPFDVANHRLRVTASLGIALFPSDGSTFTELLRNADSALHRGKIGRRSSRTFYDAAMNAATLERLMLEEELRQAILEGQLRAHLQPKVRLSDGIIVGAEALVRWQHPTRGLVPPGLFIPVAEGSDLIIGIGEWMIEEVCRQLAAWQAKGMALVPVAINLTPRHFQQPELGAKVEARLNAHGLPPKVLQFELTESTVLEGGSNTVALLEGLRARGLELALDDFGTGYSSLSYLKRLPVSSVKIDRSFVRDLVASADDRTIAGTIVTLGHQLGLVVVAEGVETEAQRAILLEQGCDEAQGYLFARPCEPDTFARAWLMPPGVPAASGSDDSPLPS